VVGGVRVGEGHQQVGDVLGVEAGAGADLLGQVRVHLLDGGARRRARARRELAVELQPVARGQGHGALEPSGADQVLGQPERTGAQASNGVQIDVLMGCDECEEDHSPFILDGHGKSSPCVTRTARGPRVLTLRQ
jgi:hypothetical protein